MGLHSGVRRSRASKEEVGRGQGQKGSRAREDIERTQQGEQGLPGDAARLNRTWPARSRGRQVRGAPKQAATSAVGNTQRGIGARLTAKGNKGASMEEITQADPRSADDVARLTAEVESLRARLETLEAGGRPDRNGTGAVHHAAPQSRREILKLAGAAAAGAAGSIVLGAVPAAATNTQPIVLGNQTTNDAATTTDIFPTTATAPAPLFQATGQGVTTTTTVPPTTSSTAPITQSIPLIGAIGPGGSLPPIGNPPVNDYPGYAPIQGVGGTATITTSTGPKVVSEGVNGYGSGATGIGITGESDVGYGLVGGSGGHDNAALGNGRVLQLALPNAMLTSAPKGPPNYTPNDFEQTRDGNGLVYVSLPGGA